MKKGYYFTVTNGIPFARVRESDSYSERPVYSQEILQNDLEGNVWNLSPESQRTMRVSDSVEGVRAGDVIFSISGMNAAVVSEKHDGYLFSQNFMILRCTDKIEPTYLVYLLNEDRGVQKQLRSKTGSGLIARISVRDIQDLELTGLPDLKTQKRIGEIYLCTKRLTALRKKVAEEKEQMILSLLKGETNERSTI